MILRKANEIEELNAVIPDRQNMSKRKQRLINRSKMNHQHSGLSCLVKRN